MKLPKSEKYLIALTVVILAVWITLTVSAFASKAKATDTEEPAASSAPQTASLGESETTILKGAIITPDIYRVAQPFSLRPIHEHSSPTEPSASPAPTDNPDNTTPEETPAEVIPDETAPSEAPKATVTTEVTKLLPSVPLDAATQKAVFEDVCQGDWEKFVMLIAVGHQETDGSFDIYALGDNGAAFGWLQVQPRWHWARMNRLGIYSADELYDPVKCARVALDYLEWIKSNRGVTTMTHGVYVVYNAGHYTTYQPTQDRATAVMNYYASYAVEFAAVNF